MGWMFKNLMGGVCILVGFFFCITIIGAVIGIPLIIAGFYLALKSHEDRTKTAVEKALKEREKETEKTEVKSK